MKIPIHKIPDELAQKYNSFFSLLHWGGKRQVIHTPHRHAFNELVFIFNDGGEHEIDFCTYPIKTQSVHLVGSAQVHQINRTDEAAGCSLMFSTNFLYPSSAQELALTNLPFFDNNYQPIVFFDAATFDTIKQLVAQITIAHNSPEADKFDLIRSYLQVIFVYIKRNLSTYNAKNTTTPTVVQRFMALVEQHYNKNWSLSEYAAELHISANYLNDLCKRETEQTAHQCIQNRILLEAKRQLCYTSQSIKEIAYDLGFEDSAYFSRFFKKCTQVSPIDYRNAAEIR
jgi:AraC family transcriptional activator of pobA